MHALKNTEAINYLTTYRLVKLNYVRYHFHGFLVNFDYDIPQDSGTPGSMFISPDVNNILGNVPFYVI